MKIIIVSPWFYPHLERGGTPIAAYNFALGLAKSGNDVTVLTTSNYANRKFSATSNYNSKNLNIVYADPLLKFTPRSELMSFRLLLNLVLISDKNTLVYVHTSRNLYSIFSFVLKKMGLIRGYIICPHGSYTKNWVELIGYRRLKLMYIKLIENLIVNSAMSLHYLDEAEAKDQSSLIIKCPYFVVPNGLKYIEPAEFKKTKPLSNNALHLVFLGRIHPQKNLLNIVNAMSVLQDKNVYLDIYGPVDNEDYYTKICDISPKNVAFKGFLKNEDVSEVLKNYDVFVLCSIVEGVSIALLEALAAGLPVLYSRGLANSKLLDTYEVGVNVDDASVHQIIQGINVFLERSENLEQISENSRSLCKQQYSFEIVSQSLDENIKRCFDKK